MGTTEKLYWNSAVWLIFFIIFFFSSATFLYESDAALGLTLIIAIGAFWLAVLGALIQGYFIKRKYFQFGIFSVFIVGTILLAPTVSLVIFLGSNGFWLLVKWLIIPGYGTTLISYYLTEIWPRYW